MTYEHRVEKIKQLKDKVDYILSNDVKARDCDNRLANLVWYEFYRDLLFKDSEGVWSVRLRYIEQLPQRSAIERVRRTIQNTEGKYLPTSWEVAQKRGINEFVWREALGYQ